MNQFRFSRRPDIGDKISVSFEFFPPKTDEMEARLWDTVTRLEPLKPKFVSVTYGAGGSTRERTARTVSRILTETGLTPAAHLTCVDASARRDRRGDPRIRGDGRQPLRRAARRPGRRASATPTGRIRAAMPTARNWSAALKAVGDFDISVSAYPEKHPESPDFATDIEMLKRKVDNGATRAITQFFFDNDLYERYVERVRRAGIYIPIVPGILPVHNFRQVAEFLRSAPARMCRHGWPSASTGCTTTRRRTRWWLPRSPPSRFWTWSSAGWAISISTR